jgi:hypothetical protein
MSTKTKKILAKPEKLLEIAQQAGLVLMSAAVTLGMLELPSYPDKRVVLPNQPAFATANERGKSNDNNTLRRESQETEQHYVSYSVAQRTPARSGRS